MLFNSISFLIFFPIVVFVYFLFPSRLWLLAASYYFYMCWNPEYALLIAASTILTYLTGLLLGRIKEKDSDNIHVQKLLIVCCCIVNLGMLIFFKYFDFLLDNINIVLNATGFKAVEKRFDVILPVGISFYTFQALGYILDVYKNKIHAERSFVSYALFVSFFPQLVAGPIERSGNLLEQIARKEKIKLWNCKRISNGLLYMLYGYFLKLVIADRIAIYVDRVFDSWFLYGGVELLLAAVGFSLQIYCDFSSYSIIAIGAAQVLGFTLMENFEAPYFSKSTKEFWRRWHISLSTWFRDYIYIPLGGRRCTKVRRYVNLMVTFLLSGLWHGANWTFVIWGAINGIYQITGEVLRPLKTKIYPYLGINVSSISYKIGQVIITFALSVTAWVFFSAESISDAVYYLIHIFTRWNPWVIWDRTLYNLGLSNYEWNILIIAVIWLFIVDFINYRKKQRIDIFLSEEGTFVKGIVIVFMSIMVIIFGIYGGGYDAKQFIYFQF